MKRDQESAVQVRSFRSYMIPHALMARESKEQSSRGIRLVDNVVLERRSYVKVCQSMRTYWNKWETKLVKCFVPNYGPCAFGRTRSRIQVSPSEKLILIDTPYTLRAGFGFRPDISSINLPVFPLLSPRSLSLSLFVSSRHFGSSKQA